MSDRLESIDVAIINEANKKIIQQVINARFLERKSDENANKYYKKSCLLQKIDIITKYMRNFAHVIYKNSYNRNTLCS